MIYFFFFFFLRAITGPGYLPFGISRKFNRRIVFLTIHTSKVNKPIFKILNEFKCQAVGMTFFFGYGFNRQLLIKGANTFLQFHFKRFTHFNQLLGLTIILSSSFFWHQFNLCIRSVKWKFISAKSFFKRIVYQTLNGITLIQESFKILFYPIHTLVDMASGVETVCRCGDCKAGTTAPASSFNISSSSSLYCTNLRAVALTLNKSGRAKYKLVARFVNACF